MALAAALAALERSGGRGLPPSLPSLTPRSPHPTPPPQLAPGGKGELVMQKRLAGVGGGGADDENDDPEGGAAAGRAGGSKGGALEKYSGVKVKVGAYRRGCALCAWRRSNSCAPPPSPPAPLSTSASLHPRSTPCRLPPARRCRLAAARRC